MAQLPPSQSQNAEPEATRNVMVNYIPTTIDELQLRQLFERFGEIESIKIVVDRETRQSRGYGFVKFAQSGSAAIAIQELNGFAILNKRLKVALANHGQQQPGSHRGGNRGGQFQAPQPQLGGYGANPYAQQQQMQLAQQQQMMALQYQQYLAMQQQQQR